MSAQPNLFDVGKPLGIPKSGACTPSPIGSGPEGKTCRHCEHYATFPSNVKIVRKCLKMEAVWTHGPGTDIKASWPACRMFEEPNQDEKTDG